VIRDAVSWSSQPPDEVRKRFPDVKFGLAGIEAYAEDVGVTAKEPDEYFKEGAWCACHAINPQWPARNSTGMYLERVAEEGLFGEEVNRHLVAAAREYKAAYEEWKAFYKALGHKAPEGSWKDEERRRTGGSAARKWFEHESAAIRELKEALVHLEQ
jgi:hypothetical protein